MKWIKIYGPQGYNFMQMIYYLKFDVNQNRAETGPKRGRRKQLRHIPPPGEKFL